MNTALYLLSILWLASVAKTSLFWLYLSQLKEYRLDRLIDHFRTDKGKKILLNPLLLVKLALLAISFAVPFFVYLLIALYAGELILTLKNVLARNLKHPAITSKSILLTGATIIIELALLIGTFWLSETSQIAYRLLILDLVTPLIVLLLVLTLRPINQILRRRITKAAKDKRAGLKNLLVIGITGSYGKTSTKEFLYTILKDKFKVIKTPEHVNTEIGIAKFILSDLKPEHEIFICEIGAYVKGEVKDICEIVKPKIGVFVGANEQHLALFGSMQNLLRAEGGSELLESLPPKGLAIFNGNNQYSYELSKQATNPKRVTYAPNLIKIINPDRRDVRAENIDVITDKIKLRVLSNKNATGADFTVNVLGGHNAENILLSVAVAEELGMSLEEIARAAFQIEPLKGTMSLKYAGGLTIINSTYSTNPTAVEAHLEYLKVWPGKKIIVMPCLIELGSPSVKIHERIGGLLAKASDLAIITTRDRFDDIYRGAAKVIGNASEKIIHLENPQEILHKIKLLTEKGDVVLLEGRLPKELIDNLENL